MAEKENIIIVESPAKAKTIERILGKDFKVKSSFGHIRDLSKKKLGIHIEKNFEPDYIVPEEKKKVVSELKKAVSDAKTVWLASDEDREGEAIAWHLSEVLKLDPEKTKRIVFHEITQQAILRAVEQPREINISLVNAQQARRVLDRLVGFELSPVLWKKVKPALSAGRVQSVAVRLLVEREREILFFKPDTYFRVTAIFYFDRDNEKYSLKAELSRRMKTKKEVTEFLNFCMKTGFFVENLATKPVKRTPPPPFTTSTLQQEANRKLGYGVSYTMSLAQRLYEAGHITYMRTDSVNLSELALNTARTQIKNMFGDAYTKTRKYRTKSKGAQEAHEAIRPTYLNKDTVSASKAEKKLYELIWKRTLASQMEDARLEKTTVTITPKGSPETFTASGEIIVFDGFLKLYQASSDEDTTEAAPGFLPPVEKGQELLYKEIRATERFTQPPPRYSEAALVKRMEELGIGRPSTYAPTISTIQQRGYVAREDRPGELRNIAELILKGTRIDEKSKTESFGKERGKLIPTNIGIVVNDFLVKHFEDIINYNFTATVEKQFDEIAQGTLNWTEMIRRFYTGFHPKVEETIRDTDKQTGERILGKDPESGEEVIVKIGRYGPVVQIGRPGNDKKPRYASLRTGQLMETLSLEEALALFRLPRNIGEFEGHEIIVAIGRYGPYVRHNGKFYSIPVNTDDPYTLTLERALEIIVEKREAEKKKIIHAFDDGIKVLQGRWGPYITFEKKNYKIPKGLKAETLTCEECKKIIKENPPTSRKTKKS
ncbi:MAG: type I DNA topoisomerase [Chlorobi bacterium]|nr:type I DNA topoisomerase [Chlorobiota bacterium]